MAYSSPFTCKNCGDRASNHVRCPVCFSSYCKTCFPGHEKYEKNKRIAKLLSASSVRRKERELENARLKDTQGTPTPAAANPFIYRRGTGRPDEPPEGAGAPNRPRVKPEIIAK